jgi:hypothetical protein
MDGGPVAVELAGVLAEQVRRHVGVEVGGDRLGAVRRLAEPDVPVVAEEPEEQELGVRGVPERLEADHPDRLGHDV